MTHGRKRTYALLIGLFSLSLRILAIDPIDRQPHAVFSAALKSGGHERIAQGAQSIIAKDGPTGEYYAATSLLFVTTIKGTGEWTLSVAHDKAVGSTVLIGTGLRRPAEGEVPALPSFDRGKAASIGAAYYPDELQRMAKEGYRRMFSGQLAFTMKAALETAAKYPRPEIDARLVKLTVEGKETTIAQADLRRIMAGRVKALTEQRAQLERSRADARELARIDDLLKQYGSAQEEPDEAVIRNMSPVFADVLVSTNGTFKVIVVDQYGTCATIAFGEAFSEKL